MKSTLLWMAAATLVPAHADTPLDASKLRAAGSAAVSGVRGKTNASGLRAGQTATVQLVISGARAGDASVQLSADSAALRVLKVDGAAPAGSVALAPGAERRIDVEVSASSDGMHYLNAILTQNGRRAATAVPLRVGTGSVSMKREGQVQTTPSGERIISLPAN